MNTTFENAKQQAIRACVKEIQKRSAKGYDTRYPERDLARLQALKGWPTNSGEIRDLDVAYKAKIAKADLSERYPDRIWSVRIERYSMGSSINITFTGPELAYEEKRAIENLYADLGKTDTQIDYFDYDNHCFVGREIPVPVLVSSQ